MYKLIHFICFFADLWNSGDYFEPFIYFWSISQFEFSYILPHLGFGVISLEHLSLFRMVNLTRSCLGSWGCKVMGWGLGSQQSPFSSAKCGVAYDSEGSPGMKIIFWTQKWLVLSLLTSNSNAKIKLHLLQGDEILVTKCVDLTEKKHFTVNSVFFFSRRVTWLNMKWNYSQ